MGPWISALTWGANLVVLGIVGMGKWGAKQHNNAQQALYDGLKARIESLESARKEQSMSCAKHAEQLAAVRSKTNQLEQSLEQVTEAMDKLQGAVEKVNDRLNIISENMLKKSDLELLLKFRAEV